MINLQLACWHLACWLDNTSVFYKSCAFWITLQCLKPPFRCHSSTTTSVTVCVYSFFWVPHYECREEETVQKCTSLSPFIQFIAYDGMLHWHAMSCYIKGISTDFTHKVSSLVTGSFSDCENSCIMSSAAQQNNCFDRLWADSKSTWLNIYAYPNSRLGLEGKLNLHKSSGVE